MPKELFETEAHSEPSQTSKVNLFTKIAAKNR